MLSVDSEDFEKAMGNLSNNLDELGASEHHVTADEILNAAFMSKHTKFKSIEEMLEAAGFSDREDSQGPELDAFIAVNTRFKNYEDMAAQGAEEWTIRKLGL